MEKKKRKEKRWKRHLTDVIFKKGAKFIFFRSDVSLSLDCHFLVLLDSHLVYHFVSLISYSFFSVLNFLVKLLSFFYKRVFDLQGIIHQNSSARPEQLSAVLARGLNGSLKFWNIKHVLFSPFRNTGKRNGAGLRMRLRKMYRMQKDKWQHNFHISNCRLYKEINLYYTDNVYKSESNDNVCTSGLNSCHRCKIWSAKLLILDSRKRVKKKKRTCVAD